MNELIYLPNNQAPESLFGVIGGLYLITPAWNNTPFVGQFIVYEPGMKMFSGGSFSPHNTNGYLVHNERGALFIPYYDTRVLGVLINAQVHK